MTAYLQGIPAVEWLISPLGLGVAGILLALVFSGLLGRIVLYVETLHRPGEQAPNDSR